MIEESITAELSVIPSMEEHQNKRKRDFLRQASQTSVDDEVRCHKRTNSKNAIFRISPHDVEVREEAEFDEDELNLVNAYRSRHSQEENESRREPLNLPSTPVDRQCEYLTFSPVTSFFHPAILRATTICESASDIFCGDPPEMESRPSSPQEFETSAKVSEPDAAAKEKRKERETPSWLNGPSRTFNWSIPKSSSGSSPWTGVFQLGSS